jgi:hypothetical protein
MGILLAVFFAAAVSAQDSQVIPNPADRLRGQEQLQQQLRNQADPSSAEGSGVNAKILRRQERKAARRLRVHRKPKRESVLVD